MTQTMDFFGHQQRARSASKWLVVLFVLAVVSIVILVYLVAIVTLNVSDVRGGAWQPGVFILVAGGVVATVVIAMLFKTTQLSAGGGTVAQMMGGRRVDPATTDHQDKVLHNVVEEMAIASGIPVPEVYVLDGESGMNAFAAGWGTEDAAVAVTRGLLENLDRAELQGVIAHEFSHVFHGDMRLNIRLMGVLFGIMCLTTIGRILLYSGGGRDRKNGGGVVVFGLALVLIGFLGVLFARLIQAAVSRQREYLADASAVAYTRNPRGIGMALAKIGGIGSVVDNAHADETSHMMFATGVKSLIGGAFATHPPIVDRVTRVLPAVKSALQHSESMAAAVDSVAPPAGAAGFAGGDGAAAGGAATVTGGTAAAASGTAAAASDTAGGGVRSGALLEHVGDPQPEHVAAARDLIKQLPLDLVAAAHDRHEAPALVLAMLFDRDSNAQKAQLEKLAERDSPEVQRARMFVANLGQAGERALLPLLEMAIPALRRLPAGERDQLRRTARHLAEADAKITPFEFALLKTVEKFVPASGDGARPTQNRRRPSALAQHGDAIAVVLSTLARVGADDEAEIERAFTTAARHLAIPSDLRLLPEAASTIIALERSLDELEPVSPHGKRNLLAACVAAAGADGIILPSEADLLRAIAELWDCPIPLVVNQAAVTDATA